MSPLPPLSTSSFTVPPLSSPVPQATPGAESTSRSQQHIAKDNDASSDHPSASRLSRTTSTASAQARPDVGHDPMLDKSRAAEPSSSFVGAADAPAPSSLNGKPCAKARVRTSRAGRLQSRSNGIDAEQGVGSSDEEEYNSDQDLRRHSLGPPNAQQDDEDDDERPEVIVTLSPNLHRGYASSSEDDLADLDDDGTDEDDIADLSNPLPPPSRAAADPDDRSAAAATQQSQISPSHSNLSLSKIATSDEQAIASARAKILGAAGASIPRSASGGSLGLGLGEVEEESSTRFGRSESQRSYLAQSAAEDSPAETGKTLAPPAISVSSKKDVPMKIAIAGRPGSGKTTLIDKAFAGWPLSSSSTIAPGIEMRTARPELKSRIPQLVQLFEIDSSRLDSDEHGRVRMPKECGELEAIVVCFDAGDQSSLVGVEELCRLRETDVPFLVFACKAAGVPRPKEVSIALLAPKIGRLIEISLERDATREQKSRSKYHQAFSFLLREAYNRRHGTYSPLPLTPTPGHPAPKINHPALRTPPSPLKSSTSFPQQQLQQQQPPLPTMHVERSPGHKPNTSESSIFSTGSQQRLADEVLYQPAGSSTPSSRRLSRDSPGVVTPGDSIKSSWIVEDEWHGSQHNFPRIDPSSKERDRNGNLMFFTLEELLGHLWLHAFTGELRNFHKYFFWTYRRFARPRDVVRFITEDMLKLDGKELAGTYGQHKWCNILGYWIENHPRDFAAPGTAAAFDDLFDLIDSRPHLSHFGDKFLPFACQLEHLVPEVLPWAVPDVDDAPSSKPSSQTLDAPETGVMVSTTTTVSYGSAAASADNLLATISDPSLTVIGEGVHLRLSHSLPPTRPMSMSTRVRNDSSTSRKSGSSAGDSSTALSLGEHGFSKAISNGSGSALSSTTSASSLHGSHNPWESRALARVVSRFNDASDLQLANDITRLVWRYFLRITPRDVLTHVLSGSSEGQDTSLGNSMRHFYDISAVFDDVSDLFVLLIYSQIKTKQRARMYERIIRIVHLLRTQNNYIALMSGMTALSDVWMGRLKATKDLAQASLEKAGDGAIYKKFQSHFRLVENRQNYKNYRLAVKEDETARRAAIPLMPVIIADVNRVAQTDDRRKSDGAIVWSKFDKFGQILNAMVTQQAKGCPVLLTNAPNLVELMLKERPDVEEKALYRRCDELAAEEQNMNSLSSAFRRLLPKNHT